MIRPAMRSLRKRAGGFAASFLAMFLGAVMVMSFGAMRDTSSMSGATGAAEETLWIMASVVGGWGTLLVILAVSSTLTLSVRQRAEEMALLHSTDQVPESVSYAFGPVALVMGLTITVVSAAGAAVIAVRRTARAGVVRSLADAAVGEARMSRKRVTAGIVFLVIGLYLAVMTMTVMKDEGFNAMATAGQADIMASLGLALLAPWLIRRAAAVLSGPLRLFGVAGDLAVSTLRRRTGQPASVAMPIILFTGAATGTLYLQEIENKAMDAAGLVSTVEQKNIATLNYVVIGMLLLFTAVMLVNTLLAATAYRRGEFGQQRLTGATRWSPRSPRPAARRASQRWRRCTPEPHVLPAHTGVAAHRRPPRVVFPAVTERVNPEPDRSGRPPPWETRRDLGEVKWEREAVMPAVLDEAEQLEPSTEPEIGLVPLRDPGDVGDAGIADRPGAERDELRGAARAARAAGAPRPGVARSSLVMAVGTVFSRATGFLRTTVLSATLGIGLLGDAYQTADMIPFTVYALLLGGLLSSVFVPFLVKRRRRDADGGAATEQRLFTAALVGLLVLTVVAVLAAGPLISLYAGGYEGRQREIAVLLTRLLLIQILFIGISGVAGTLLNVRERFGAPMWAPIVNNLITIAAGLTFLVIAGTDRGLDSVTDAQLSVLAVGSASGTVVQSLLLAWSLWRAGFRWRPRFDLRGSGFGEAARAALWMLVYIVVAQAGLLATANVATRAGARAAEAGEGGAGLAAYKFAEIVFQLPYAIIAVSVITALLPRMSSHVADGRRDLLRADFSRGLRLSSVMLVPLSAAMLVFAIPGAIVLFAYGSTQPADARRIGMVLMVFAVMVIPFTLFQLQMRVFYALGDTRTPGILAIPAGVVQAAVALALLALLPPGHVVFWLPVAFGLFYLVGTAGATMVLRRRLGGMDGRRILRTLTLLYLAAVPGALFGAACVWAFGHLPGGRVPGLVAMAVGGLGGGLLYLGAARLMRIAEVGYFVAVARARVPFLRPRHPADEKG